MSSFTQYVLYIEEVNSMHIPKQTLYYVMLQYIIQSAKNIAQHCAISFYILTSMANSITKAVLRYGPLLWQTRTFIYTAVYLIYVLHYWAKASRVIFFWFARGVDFISISVYYFLLNFTVVLLFPYNDQTHIYLLINIIDVC